ncbi:MAG: hypothetical protein WD738_15530 [Pirellulales bacterium]
MLAPKQRRRFSFYLAVLSVIVFVPVLVAKLVALQRADVIAELADQVAHRESPEAAAAVRQLASMPGLPVAILVSAATSADREVAEEAKLSIGRLLRRAQRQLHSERGVGAVARQLAELAESLAAQQEMFSRADYPWLSNTTHKVLRLANRIPPRHTPLVAVHCDAILAAIASKEISPAKIVGTEPAADEPIINDGASAGGSGESRQARLQPMPVQATADAASIGSVGSPATTPNSLRPSQAVASAPTQVSGQMRDESSADTSAEELIKAPWRASWSHPIFRMVPAMPIHESPNEENPTPSAPISPVPEAPAAEPAAADRPLAEVDAHELLRRWLAAEGGAILPLEEELTRRGFGRLSERMVGQLFSTVSDDRLSLVDAVLTEPGVNARPWLMLLSEDSDADVRLLAVTMMATSNDAALIEKAWQVSIRDRDPRIAGLAGRLRERREAALRR